MLNGIDVQWILVDDGSKMQPNSNEIERLKTTVENFEFIQLNKNFGKGYAVRMGMGIWRRVVELARVLRLHR